MNIQWCTQMKDRVNALEARIEGLTAHSLKDLALIEALEARITQLEQKRGPGRPPKDENVG